MMVTPGYVMMIWVLLPEPCWAATSPRNDVPALMPGRLPPQLKPAWPLSRVDTAYSFGAGDRCDPSATGCSDPCPSVTGPASADAWPWFLECAAFRY
jgi:hypothetical protein